MGMEITERILEKEAECENRIRDAAAECSDRLRQMMAENKLRVKNVRRKLEEQRHSRTEQEENMARERESAVLADARKEADALRRNAMANMDAAVAYVQGIVLGNI